MKSETLPWVSSIPKSESSFNQDSPIPRLRQTLATSSKTRLPSRMRSIQEMSSFPMIPILKGSISIMWSSYCRFMSSRNWWPFPVCALTGKGHQFLLDINRQYDDHIIEMLPLRIGIIGNDDISWIDLILLGNRVFDDVAKVCRKRGMGES